MTTATAFDRLDATSGKDRTNGVVDKLLAPSGALVELIDLKLLHEHPDNPRGQVGDVQELADSIRSVGILEPLLVASAAAWQEHDDRLPALGIGDYVVIAGHRRLKAARQAKLTSVPCLVRDDLVGADAEVAMIVENLQREDLPVFDEAHAFVRLRDVHGKTQGEIARMVGRSQSHVSKRISLTQLPGHLQAQVGGRLTVNDAVMLAQYADQPKIMDAVASRGRHESAEEAARRAAERIKREEDYAAAKKSLEAQNAKIVPWNTHITSTHSQTQTLDCLAGQGVDVSDHLHFACHAIALGYDYMSQLHQDPVCTNPKTHAGSVLAQYAKEHDDKVKKIDRDRITRDKRRGARMAIIKDAIAGGVDSDLEQLALNLHLLDLFDSLDDDDLEVVALMVGADVPARSDDVTTAERTEAIRGNIQRFAERSSAGLKRVHAAATLVDADYWCEAAHDNRGAALLHWMQSRGHKLSGPEREVIQKATER